MIKILLLSLVVFMMAPVYAKSEMTGNKEMTKIIMTTGEKSWPAVLYDNESAQALAKRLPAKFSLSRGSRDYCGSMGDKLPYTEKDVHAGYKNGDLVYWLSGNDFVIFTEREESSNEVEGCVTLGKITGNANNVLNEIKSIGHSMEILLIPDGKVEQGGD